jgi:wyosine [tRNA(Phe)-imidazoG37] synthetase (radical SAM superfamily)
VYRLTLVKGYNMSDVQGYAELIKMGNPSLIGIHHELLNAHML